MPNTNMDAILFCLECNQDTKHTITYKNNKIEKIKCDQCEIELKINQKYIEKHFKEEVINRVLSKPSRMTKEIEKDITILITQFPYRIISKPYRILKEIYEKGK